MQTLDDAIIAKKNSLAEAGAFILLAELTLGATTFRVADNRANVDWNGGAPWIAFPFELDSLGEAGQNEVPSFTVRIGNDPAGTLRAAIEAVDGAIGGAVTFYLVQSAELSVVTGVPTWSLEIVGCSINSKWIVFKLGAANLYRRRFPQQRILKNVCRHRFQDSRCKYTTPETVCDKSLKTCRDIMHNSANFGGFPGVGSGSALQA
jgi:phage-related protein